MPVQADELDALHVRPRGPADVHEKGLPLVVVRVERGRERNAEGSPVQREGVDAGLETLVFEPGFEVADEVPPLITVGARHRGDAMLEVALRGVERKEDSFALHDLDEGEFVRIDCSQWRLRGLVKVLK